MLKLGSIETLPVLASLPAAGTYPGGLFRVGTHLFLDTGLAVVQLDQQSPSNTLLLSERFGVL